MVISPSPTKALETIDRIRHQMEGVREEGVHISDLVYCLRKAYARSQGMVSTELDPSTVLLFATGRAIQDYITGKPAEESERHLLVDGVYGTADYVDEEGVPWEIKATYASAARDILDSPHYIDQLVAYCHMLGVTEGCLAVFYINGYYDFMRKKPREGAVDGERSVLKVYHLTFTPEEVEEHWQRLMARRSVLEDSKNFYDIPVQHHYDWECKFCPLYQNDCEGGKAAYINHWIGDAVWE